MFGPRRQSSIGGTIQTGHDEIVANDAADVNDITVDSEAAYWVELGDAPDYLNGRLRRIAHGATAAETLAVSITLSGAVAVDGGQASPCCRRNERRELCRRIVLLVTPKN